MGLFIIALLVALAGGGYYYMKKKKAAKAVVTPVAPPTPVPAPVVVPVPAPVPVALPDGCRLANIPAAPGLVYLDSLPSGSPFEHTAFAILEVTQSFPAGSAEVEFILKNVNNANGMQRVNGQNAFFPACSSDFGRAPNIAGTLALPSYDQLGADKLGTVKSAVKYYQAWVPVAPGGGSFVPGK